MAKKRRSLVQVDLPFQCSLSSDLASGREIDSVELDHRKRSSGPRKPTGSVLDRRNVRKPGVIWWYEDALTNSCARQLVPIRRSEVEGPRPRTVGMDVSCEDPGEPTELGRSTLGSRVGRRRRNIDHCRERPAERQRRATSRRCLNRPQAGVRGRRW